MLKFGFVMLFSVACLAPALALAQNPPAPPPGPEERGFRRFAPGPGGPEFGPGDGFGPGPGFGMRRGFGPGSGPGALPFLFNERMRSELGLTDDQASRLRRMESEVRKSAIRTRAEMEMKQIDLQELLSAAKPDRAAIDRTIREIADQRAAQMKAQIDMRLGLQEVLTPAQREKLRGLARQRFREGGPAPGAEGPRQRGGQPGPGAPVRPGPGPRKAPAPPSPPQ